MACRRRYCNPFFGQGGGLLTPLTVAPKITKPRAWSPISPAWWCSPTRPSLVLMATADQRSTRRRPQEPAHYEIIDAQAVACPTTAFPRQAERPQCRSRRPELGYDLTMRIR